MEAIGAAELLGTVQDWVRVNGGKVVKFEAESERDGPFTEVTIRVTLVNTKDEGK